MYEKNLLLPPEEIVIQYVNRERKKGGISETDIGQVLSLNQSNISRLLTGNRRLRYKEAYEIVLLILKRFSSMPNKSVDEYCTNSENVEFVFSDEPIFEAAKKMKDGGFTQLPVIDKESEGCIGIVTDLALLERMLNPIKSTSKEKWLKQMKNTSIKDANVIDKVPKYPSNSLLIEVAEGLKHHYAVLIEENRGRKVGLITRSDFLKLLI